MKHRGNLSVKSVKIGDFFLKDPWTLFRNFKYFRRAWVCFAIVLRFYLRWLRSSSMYSKFLVSLPLLVITAPWMTLENFSSSNERLAFDDRTSKMCGSSRSPKKSVASRGNCVGMLSIEHTRQPGPLKLKIRKNNSLIFFIHCHYISIHHSQEHQITGFFPRENYDLIMELDDTCCCLCVVQRRRDRRVCQLWCTHSWTRWNRRDQHWYHKWLIGDEVEEVNQAKSGPTASGCYWIATAT